MKRLLLGVITVVVAITFCPLLYAQDKAAEGKKVFEREKCGVCHNAKLNSLESVGSKLTAEQIREWIVNPTASQQKAKSTSKLKMPVKKLSPDDIDALVAYLGTMKK
jgi:cytochrome c553